MNNLDKRILEITKVYDNNGETYDRYTVFTPDGAVYGMSEGGEGFNQYIGDYTEVEMGEHLGTKLDSVPESIKNAVLNRMVDSQFVDLFQYFELMPENVSAIFDMYYEMSGGDWDYDNLSKLQEELKELGYTFDYGLDAEPYGLRPIELSLNQLKDFEEYAKGGNINSGREAMFKSQEPHEQRYKRKREWKEYKKEGWFGDWFRDGGVILMEGDMVKIMPNYPSIYTNEKAQIVREMPDGKTYEVKIRHKTGNEYQKFDKSELVFLGNEPKWKLEKGGGVGEIDMNDIEKQANFYTDESRWTTKPTIEKFDKEIMEYQDLKLQLDNNQIRPSKIIGTGFKPQYARPLAYKWINERILVAKRAIEILIERQKQSKEGDISNLQKKIDYINKNYDGVTASKTYSDNRIQVVSPYFNTLNEIKRKEFEGSGLMERYGNTSSYVLYSNQTYEMGGGMDDYTKSLGMVRVKFADPKYNYETNVSGNITEEKARNYFVGKMFDVGTYPNENMQKVIDIDFYPKGSYANGGGIGNEEEMVKSNLYNGEISCEKLTEIIGCKPNYPYQIVGAIKLEKCYLRPYYKLV